MQFSMSLNDWLAAAGSNPAWQILAIILGTFILEDATTIAAAVLVADGDLALGTALTGLYSGVILGDLGLYTLGRIAGSHPRSELLVKHRRLAPFRQWLESQLMLTVFAVRFVPGLRLPTYTASGFFRMPFGKFALTVVLATTIWTSILFFASYMFGALTARTLGVWRWPIGLGVVVALALIGRANMKKFAPRANEVAPEDNSGDE